MRASLCCRTLVERDKVLLEEPVLLLLSETAVPRRDRDRDPVVSEPPPPPTPTMPLTTARPAESDDRALSVFRVSMPELARDKAPEPPPLPPPKPPGLARLLGLVLLPPGGRSVEVGKDSAPMPAGTSDTD